MLHSDTHVASVHIYNFPETIFFTTYIISVTYLRFPLKGYFSTISQTIFFTISTIPQTVTYLRFSTIPDTFYDFYVTDVGYSFKLSHSL
jgi:hypothetical protein